MSEEGAASTQDARNTDQREAAQEADHPNVVDKDLGALLGPKGDVTTEDEVTTIPPPDLVPPKNQWAETLAKVGLAAWFSLIFTGVVVWACWAASGTPSTEQWDRVKDLLAILLPVISGVLGGAVAYFYTTNPRK